MSLAPDFEPQVTVRAPAKVNLTLRVGPVRADGFHPLETVYQAIGLYDDVTVSSSLTWSVEVEHLAPGLGSNQIDLSEVPIGPDNIVVRPCQHCQGHPGGCRARGRQRRCSGDAGGPRSLVGSPDQ